MLRFLDLVRKAVWRAFQHDAFAIAKASAYSSILTFFPSLLAVGSVLAARRNTQALLGEISERAEGHSSHRSCHRASVSEERTATLLRSDLDHDSAGALAGLRRDDFVDGRFPPLLRTAQNLGLGQRAAGLAVSGHPRRHSAEPCDHLGSLRKPHRDFASFLPSATSSVLMFI